MYIIDNKLFSFVCEGIKRIWYRQTFFVKTALKFSKKLL